MPIDAPNRPGIVGDARWAEKKIRKIKFGNYRCCKFGRHCLLAQDASLRQYIGAAQVYPSLILQQISETTIRRILPFRQDIAYWFCFTGAEAEILKIKDDSKIKRERTSIAAVRDILWTFGTFPTPLLPRYRLPFNQGCESRRQMNSTCTRPRFREI